MSGTITLPTAPLVTINAYGVSVPEYQDLFNYATTCAQTIFGSDIYIPDDSQDGQLLGIFCAAWNDTNAAIVSTVAAFSPATAVGAGLSSVVKINGITRDSPSYSTVDMVLGGTVFTVINSGSVGDGTVGYWNLPNSVTIEASGTVSVTATAQEVGAVTAIANTITAIASPTYGWQTATNPTAANLGNPVEQDGALRVRQQQSTMIPSQSILDGLVGALQSLPNVTNVVPYENDTRATDANGVPGNSIAMVVDGGNETQIASTILLLKGVGCGTYGTTSVVVTDANGRPYAISFFRSTYENIQASVTITPGVGYTTTIGSEIQTAVANYINALPDYQNVLLTRLYVPAQLQGTIGQAACASPTTDPYTYELNTLTIGLVGGALAAADIVIAFNQRATCEASNVVVIT